MDEIQFIAVVGADGLIHPPEGVSLPEGELDVFVKARSKPDPAPTPASLARTRAWLLSFADEAKAAMPDLPSDMAENHDHYAHGAPKR